jgi:hypothetical protein
MSQIGTIASGGIEYAAWATSIKCLVSCVALCLDSIGREAPIGSPRALCVLFEALILTPSTQSHFSNTFLALKLH